MWFTATLGIFLLAFLFLALCSGFRAVFENSALAEKLFCKHSWKELYKQSYYSDCNVITTKNIYSCTKCGKIKKIKI